MASFSAENDAPMASYSTPAQQCMFMLATLLKRLPNDTIVFAQATCTFSRIEDVWIAGSRQCHSSDLNVRVPTSEKYKRVTNCNGRNATSRANRRPESPRHHLDTAVVDGPEQTQGLQPSLARPNSLGPPVVPKFRQTYAPDCSRNNSISSIS